ncbi:MAG: rod shape-determining protein MreC, partial [Gemmatimonadota bacterium]
VESRRGRYREEDRLALVGAPFHADVAPGTRVVTSGRGGVYPRGLLLGNVVEVEDADTGWRKSYVVRPAIRPEAVTHVLVGTGGDEPVNGLWDGDTVTDSAAPGAVPGAADGPEPGGAP